MDLLSTFWTCVCRLAGTVPVESMRGQSLLKARFLYRNERTLAWICELKRQGYKIGILSNMSEDFAIRFRATFPDFIAEADAVVLSGEERMFKPQRRIYDLVAARLGLPSDALVFIDDAETNCEGARAAGWQAIRFVSNDQVESDFARIAE